MNSYVVQYQSPGPQGRLYEFPVNANSHLQARKIIWRKLFRSGNVAPTEMEYIPGGFTIIELASA